MSQLPARVSELHAFRMKSGNAQAEVFGRMTPEQVDDILDWQCRTPVWIILRDPNVWTEGKECWTQFVCRIMGTETPSSCFVENPTLSLKIRCRTCGIKTFEVCGNELDYVEAGVAHTAPWCVYCTVASGAHEVIEMISP